MNGDEAKDREAGMKMPTIRPAAVLVALAGIALHAVTCFGLSADGIGLFNISLFLYASLPYAICLALVFVGRGRPLMALCAGLAALVMDGVTFRDVFIVPTNSTAALALLVTPAINVVLAVPFGLGAGWVLGRLFRPRRPAQ